MLHWKAESGKKKRTWKLGDQLGATAVAKAKNKIKGLELRWQQRGRQEGERLRGMVRAEPPRMNGCRSRGERRANCELEHVC